MRWIKREQEWPNTNEDKSVLCHFENGSIETVHVSDFDFHARVRTDNKITHWMELPSPPESK